MEPEQNLGSNLRIIFNENFKIFIKKLKKDIDLSSLKTGLLESAMPIQEEIRKYIEKNQNNLDILKGSLINHSPNSYPDFFAILISIIIPDLNFYNSFQEILNESQKSRWNSSLFAIDNMDGIGDKFCCACSHDCKPENLYKIHNLESGLNILTGCECILKTKFIEETDIEILQKSREDDKTYKKLIEKTKNENFEKRIKKFEVGLSKIKEDINSIKSYQYFGGNFGEHKEYFITNTETLLIKIESENCMCGQTIKNNIFIINNDDQIIPLCEWCFKYSKISSPKITQGICDDCGIKHKNKSDNFCNICRTKTNCKTCDIRSICYNDTRSNYYNKRCECCLKFNYCKTCDEIKVTNKGYNCKKCFSNLSKCNCGKIITNPKFKKCYKCNQNKLPNSEI